MFSSNRSFQQNDLTQSSGRYRRLGQDRLERFPTKRLNPVVGKVCLIGANDSQGIVFPTKRLNPVVGKCIPINCGERELPFPTKRLDPVVGKALGGENHRGNYVAFINLDKFPTKRLDPVVGKG